jgi:transposase-like protein
MNEPQKTKLSSPQERLELVLLCLARQLPVKRLCQEAKVSRELCYRWLKAVRQAGLRALEPKAPGPKRVKADPSPTEVLKLQDQVQRLEKELKGVRKERDRWQLISEVARRIIQRNAWGPIPKVWSKKNGMQSQRPESSIAASGSLPGNMAPQPRPFPGGGAFPEARTGDGSPDASAGPGGGS